MELQVEIKLSIHRALIHNLSTNVRGICCDWDDDRKWFKLVYFLSIPPNEHEIELQSVVMTELECDIQDFIRYENECLYDPRPYEELEKLRMVLLWRDE